MVTRNPAASSTSTAARAVSGRKKLLKVSGKRRTGGRNSGLGTRDSNHFRKVWLAKGGILRRRSIPIAPLASEASPGVCVKKLASRGASEAARDHQGTSPNA